MRKPTRQRDLLVARDSFRLVRINPSASEEAEAYRRLIKEFGYTQRVLAKRVGRSQSHIAKRLSLLNLPDDVRAEVDSGGITLPDALELAKLAKTPERLQKALKKGREYGGIEAAVRRQEQELQQEATQAKMVKDLKALGLTVLDWPDSGYWDTNSPVKPLRNLYWLAADAHAGEGAAARPARPGAHRKHRVVGGGAARLPDPRHRARRGDRRR